MNCVQLLSILVSLCVACVLGSEESSQCCPTGFVPSQSRKNCFCGSMVPKNPLHILDCPDDYQAVLENGFWAGYFESDNETCNEMLLYVGRCPVGFCEIDSNKSQFSWDRGLNLPRSTSNEEITKVVCSHTRTGPLCGQCRQGYGPGINIFLADCVHCETDKLSQVGWLIWMVMEILPLIISLVVVLIGNINLLKGPLNSYLLYAQIINALFPISKYGPIYDAGTGDPRTVIMLTIFSICFSTFGLQFFSIVLPPFCISPNIGAFDQLDIIMLKFGVGIFPLAVLLLILLGHWCFKQGACVRPRIACRECVSGIHCCRRCRVDGCFAGSVTNALTTFYILVFTRLLIYTGGIFNKSEVVSYNGNSKSLVTFQGSMEYFGNPRHIAYCIVSMVIVVILVIPPTLFLLAYPALPRLQSIMAESKNKTLKRLSKLGAFAYFTKSWMQHFGDLFQSSYRNKYRFFAGIELLVRIVMVIMWHVIESRDSAYMWLGILSTTLLVTHCICWPRMKPWINRLDAIMYGNLIVVAILGSSIYKQSNYPNHRSTLAFTAVMLLPATYLVVYVGWEIQHRLRRHCKKVRKNPSIAVNERTSFISSLPPSTIRRYTYEDTDDARRSLELVSSHEEY